ncbi:hypothetical protein MNEG_0163 [Monoraphidium neglectum]|uniref:Uncharacterized protein n=1 Tax=Monoraphidium neglectum TaxID=145388 RepID=A0A0D2MZF9_9CHLO|nr:hypothetical protein MNEG_0163 [Monoraphidium neglectum]KIZ07805.1 hypothetical protein MNEG_0163 [Monoraphidium neglectum]|eukprot:XP_013906824.1 hypothetical protein MNEG_0163 [Monoraphidium neglectum]
MTTYRPLLLRVKAAYDPVLRDAAASTYDNVHLRGELARAPAELAVAVEEAHNAAEAVAAGMLRELEEKLASAEAEAEEVGSRALDTRAEREARDAEDQLSRFQRSSASARREVEQLTAANRRAQAELLAASSWARLRRPVGAGAAAPAPVPAAGEPGV